jgi:hypothetical protein
MYSIDPIHPIYSAIIEIVSVYPHISVAELQVSLQKKMRVEISLAQLYRTITRMVSSQVLIKSNGKLSLNLMWVSYIEFVAARAKKILQHVDGFPLEEGQKKVYQASSLFEVEAIWNHLLVSLYRFAGEKNLYKYYSHAWWQFGRNAEEMDFYQKLKEQGINCYYIFGDTTFLDKTAEKRVGEVFSSVAVQHAPFPKDGYNLNVYGEYIIECILPEKTARYLDFFFKKVKNMKQFEHDVFLDIFTQSGRYKVTVWRNVKQSMLLRETLKKCLVECR